MSKNEKKKTPNCNQNPFIYKNIHLSVSTAAGITVGEEANLWQGAAGNGKGASRIGKDKLCESSGHPTLPKMKELRSTYLV